MVFLVRKNYLHIIALHKCATVESFFFLKDKSGVGIIVDYSRNYTVVNGM